MTSRMIVVNPLGGALLHYRRELVSVLHASGQTPELVEFPEPSAGDGSRAGWVRRYLKTLRLLRQQRNGDAEEIRVVIAWPVLGYLDLIILALLLPGAWLTVHDPVPLVRSVGYGAFARAASRLLGSRARVIVLSRAAADEVRSALPRATMRVLPHPALEPADGTRQPALPTVRVLGQYKPDRDLALLRSIVADNPGLVYSITGRGWPEVTGWEVEERFVPEEELDELIRGASVVLIPYRRFFQSGIAVRCLELGTPVVGPRDSSLHDTLVSQPALLADSSPSDWSRAIRAALALTRSEVRDLGWSMRQSAVDEWSAARL
ncbi:MULTISPECIES: hypothetical protein [unclassified Curtobacterium]|uniref:hypothetical protein n=1 Tax=unclassified Curtobacterium TaxID=257496 RepID=UPI003805469B